MIKIEDLHVIFNRGKLGQKHALNGINLVIEEGSFVSVIGSNGSGKSTLLSTLAGDISPNMGRILFDGQDVTRQTTVRRAGSVARVFQDPLVGSCASLSVEENMALSYYRGKKRGFGYALKKANRHFFKEKLADLEIGLETRMHEQMGALSGGQRQAVSLIMATLTKSNILLLDEHTAALDPGMAEFIMKLTHQLVEQKSLTTLMVTHSMRQALEFGDRTIMLDKGKIILDVKGQERDKLSVSDLIEMFRRTRGPNVDDDMLLD